MDHKGWYSRGYLPHFDSNEVIQMIGFRLADSLPEHVYERMKIEAGPADKTKITESVEQYLDSGHGACYLRDPRVASIVENAFLFFDNKRYRLLAWAIMPNHVHVLAEMFPNFDLPAVIHSWKSFTAKEANKVLGRTGEFWQREYFDTYIRNETHLSAAVNYIHDNPVKAGLVSKPEDWLFSSAASWSAGVPPAS